MMPRLAALAALACVAPPGPPPPPDFFSRALPPVGEITVVAIAGEAFSRKVLAATLQGLVNRNEVRMYLVDGAADGKRWWEAVGEEASQRFWLDRYAGAHGVRVGDEVTIVGALDRFAGEASGYVIASETEPWTLAAATTIAGIEGALVAGPGDAAALDARGLARLDDLRGRWPDADSCARDTFATLYPEANPLALGILAPGEYRLRDFLVQNRIFTVYARPDTDGWEAVQDMLAATPADQPVFGYLSLTGFKELVAVAAISRAGKFLIPSDTTANLSVHAAVRTRGAAPPAPRPLPEADCAREALRVVVAISDGDNLAIPLNRYVADRYWLDPARGEFPLGWSIGPSLARLAPAAAAYYVETRGDAEEIVGMLGIGYAHPTAMPDPSAFVAASLDAMSSLGMTSTWQLDLGLYDPAAPAWDGFEAAWTAGAIRGALVGYIALGQPAPFATNAGMPVLAAASRYEDTPEVIEQRIRDALGRFRAGGPDTVFFGAAVWSNDYTGLAEVWRRLRGEPDLAFVTPSQALACEAL